METINLLNGKEFCPEFSIMERLKEADKARSLIYTDNLRGIGKTYNLIKFAKEHNRIVAVSNGAERLREEYDFKRIYDKNDYTLCDCMGIVIDEGVTFSKIISEDSVFTGFTNIKPVEKLITHKSLNTSDYANAKEIRVNSRNLRELMAFSGISIAIPKRTDGIIGEYIGIPVIKDDSVKESFKLVYEEELYDEIINELKKDAKSLTVRLNAYQSGSDYKMLINNLKSTMELIQDLEGKQKPTTINISNITFPNAINCDEFIKSLKNLPNVYSVNN